MDQMNNQSQQQQPHQAAPQQMNGGMQLPNGGQAQQGMASAQMQMQQAGQVPPHLMGLMTNPALAAAAAASPLFPPAAMLSNPGAYLAMPPEVYTAMQQQQQQQNAGAQHGMTLPNPLYPNTQSNGVQHPQSSKTPTPIAPMGGMAQYSQNAALAVPMTAASSNANNETRSESSSTKRRADLTPEERAKQNRDRNREHARSTRLRKKAYVQKLKELVEGLHAERTEEDRQRRVAIQHLAEMQNVRRAVVRSFLRFHSNCEVDERKWSTILEDDFWLKQPVSPYRSFRRAEIEQECRISRGVDAVIADAASLSVMIEGIGSRSTRWMQMKREEFLLLERAKRGTKEIPKCIVRQESRLHHAISSLSSSSGSSNHGSSSDGSDRSNKRKVLDVSSDGNKIETATPADAEVAKLPKQVSSSSGSSNEESNNQDSSKDFHDYHAKPLPDPKLGDLERSSPSDDSPEDSNGSSNGDTKRISTDFSSGDDSAAAIAAPRAAKRRKHENLMPAAMHDSAGIPVYSARVSTDHLPPNIAKKGGIPHNIRPVSNGTARLSLAPAVQLPPFAGIGKKHAASSIAGSTSGQEAASWKQSAGEDRAGVLVGPAVIAADVESSSNSSMSKATGIRGYYHINEDDMILMEDVIMCPYVFRSQDAVVCGALAECVMPGMLRASFSSRNKLSSVELIYDAMGFMQQLERASGNEGTAQIIPGSLEMALSPIHGEARVITLAEPPYYIVNVNEVWTKTTGYTQMEAEGKEYLTLLEGEGTVHEAAARPGKPRHKLEEVAQGRAACSTNIHYDKDRRDFVEFVCSYPLNNASDEITHLLHVSKELPSFQTLDI